MAIYYISDLHLGHENAIKFDNRPFANIKEMHDTMQSDGRDEYRREYNDMLIEKATGANGLTQEKYITVSVIKKDVAEARSYFARVGADLNAHFVNLGSKCEDLSATERLQILHSFFRQWYSRQSSSTSQSFSVLSPDTGLSQSSVCTVETEVQLTPHEHEPMPRQLSSAQLPHSHPSSGRSRISPTI